MGANNCPNINSQEWKDLVHELNDNRLVAMRAFNENGGKIPSIDSEIVKKLKPTSKLNFGPNIHTVEKDNGYSEEDYYLTDDDKKIGRVGTFVGFFSSTKMTGGDFIVEKADRLWGDNDKETFKIANRDGVPESYDEYVARRKYEIKIGAAKGKVLHYAIEMAINPNVTEENVKKIDAILREMKDEKGKQPFHWKWILNTDTRENKKGETETYFTNINKIFDNLGINYFKRNNGAFDDVIKDRIMTEVHVSLPEINLAGTMDMLVEHADGSYSIVDWKTGNNFSGRPELEDLFLMKYGDRGTKEITDNFRNRAKIQLAIYAILLKANNPGMHFRNLQIGWIPNEYIIQSVDKDAGVDVGAFIPMIEKMMADKELLKANGFDVDMKSKLIKRDHNIFHVSEYTTNAIDNEIYTEISVKGKSPQQVLEEKLNQLRYITTRNINFKDLSEKDKIMAKTLSDEITKILQEGNVVITKDSYHDMNMMERYLGNYSEVNHPIIKAWKSLKNEREKIAFQRADAKVKMFRSLLRPVMKELDKEFGVINIAGNKSYDYDKIYGWMYVGVDSKDDTGKSKERLLTNTEEDPDLKKRWDDLSQAKKRLLMYINTTFAGYFVGDNAFMNKQATYDSNFNPLSQLDLFNAKKSKLDKREYYKGFFFKLPITDEEIILRAGGGSYMKGLFKKESIQRMLYNYSTMFKEKEYENWFDTTNALPVKYLGNEYIDTSQNYTHNMEEIFKRAITEMERTEQLQDVYSLGISIRNSLADQTDPNNPLRPMYKNIVSFLDAKLVHDVQKRTEPIRWMRAKKIRLPMYNIKTGRTEEYPISMDKLIFALRSWGSMVTMWARPFRGTGNGLQAALLTHREGIKGSIAGAKFLGIDGDVIDFTAKDIGWAEAEYFRDFVPHSLGDVTKSKMYLLAKKLDYFGNNFEFQFMDRESITKRNKKFGRDIMYVPYSMPEEFVTMTTMVAMMKHLKNKATGKSLYDSYEKYEILDENGKRTGEYDVKWIGGVRGSVKKGNGETATYEKMTSLTAKEIARMKKVHERLQGNYRREEALAIEVYSLGRMFMMLKRYYPRLLMNGMHKKRIEMDLGSYKQVKDENGNDIMRTVDGKEMPVYEWMARVTEGRWITIGKYLAHMMTIGKAYHEYGWKNLSDEQKTNLIEATVVLGQWMAFYGMYLAAFGDTDDDDTAKKLWKQYLVDNLTQQYNFADLVRTLKSFGTPVAVSKAVDFVMSGTEMMFSTANYALGNNDLALTNKGDLKGWNKFAKGIPFLTSYKDIETSLKNDKSNAFSWYNWLNNGVKLQ